MFRIDETGFPIVVVTWGEKPSDEELSAYLDVHVRLLEQGERFAVLHDARLMNTVPASIRKVAVDFTAERSDEEWARVKLIIVHDSAFLRGVLNAIRWWVRNRSRLSASKSLADARAQAEAWLAEER